MKSVIRLLTIVALSLAVVFPAGGVQTARAAEPTSFNNVQLWVDPEYDDPRLLVMLEGKIVGANPPATIRFLVPSGAQMFSAGSKDAQGRYSGGPPARRPSDLPGWDEISYNVTSPTFRMEYYDSSIVGGPDKTISFQFRPLYPITNLWVGVQEPKTSSNFKVSPPAQSKGRDEGMVVNEYRYSNLDAGKPLDFSIAYTKSDPSPSITNPALSSTGNAGSSGGSSSSQPMVVIGIVFGVAALALLGFVLISKSGSGRKSRQQLRYAESRASRAGGGRPLPQGRQNQAQSRGSKGSNSPKGPVPQDKGSRFCPKCGSQQDGPGNFCTDCGGKLK